MRQAKPVLGQPPPLLYLVSDIFQNGRTGHLLKIGEDLLCRNVISHDPERQQECKEPEDVQEQNDAFGEWEMLREENVEADRQYDEQKHRQSRLPGQAVAGVRVREVDHLANNARELKSACRNSGDPSKTA